MFAHKYVTFQHVAAEEPAELTINTEMISSIGTRQQIQHSKLLNQEVHVASWVIELSSNSVITVKMECPCTDYDEQGNQIDVDVDMAYDYFKELMKHKTIEVVFMCWE